MLTAWVGLATVLLWLKSFAWVGDYVPVRRDPWALLIELFLFLLLPALLAGEWFLFSWLSKRGRRPERM